MECAGGLPIQQTSCAEFGRKLRECAPADMAAGLVGSYPVATDPKAKSLQQLKSP
jgi:hypothetical protein